jgi:formylglycine-generating enzyme required for sulfatase activity
MLQIAIYLVCFLLAPSSEEQVPPGTVKIHENFYVDQNEIRNIDYREYLYWLRKEYGVDSQEYIMSLPDTLVFADQEIKLLESYFRHPDFRDFPVVGVSYEQATSYCRWRTDRVNEQFSLKNDDPHCSKRAITKTFEYRLPTPNEWEEIAAIEFDSKTLAKMKKSGKTYGNFADNSNTNLLKITTKVRSFTANKVGLYDVFGNVAEMTSEIGIAKGGAYIHKKDECALDSIFTYDKPYSWLGFRCVCDKLN